MSIADLLLNVNQRVYQELGLKKKSVQSGAWLAVASLKSSKSERRRPGSASAHAFYGRTKISLSPLQPNVCAFCGCLGVDLYVITPEKMCEFKL